MPCGSKRNASYYRSLAKKYMNKEHKIVGSLSKKTPYGINPVTKKPFHSSKAFANAINHSNKMKQKYIRLWKKHL